MKFDCGPKIDPAEVHKEFVQRMRRCAFKRRQWHKVFAWWPRRVGPNDCRWLEYIQRRYPSASTIEWADGEIEGYLYYGYPEYRAIDG